MISHWMRLSPAAIVYATWSLRQTVSKAVYPAPGDYVIRTGIAARLSPEFVATIAQRARKTGESIVFAHSHPFSFNQFSKTDDLGELALAEFLKERTPTLSHATLLVTPEVTIARQLGSDQTLLVTGVGESVAFGHTCRAPLLQRAPVANNSGRALDFVGSG